MVAWLTVLVVVLGGLVLAAPVLWLYVDDGHLVPPSPDLPAEVTVLKAEERCGTGGCYHELTLAVPRDQSPSDVVALLGLSLRSESCAARSLVDRRQVCRWAEMAGEELRFSVFYRRGW